MRIFDIPRGNISLSLLRKNRFWVEEEGYDSDTGEYYCVSYCIEKISWRHFKKKMQKDMFVPHGRYIRTSRKPKLELVV